jgi:hypothetical protein
LVITEMRPREDFPRLCPRFVSRDYSTDAKLKPALPAVASAPNPILGDKDFAARWKHAEAETAEIIIEDHMLAVWLRKSIDVAFYELHRAALTNARKTMRESDPEAHRKHHDRESWVI